MGGPGWGMHVSSELEGVPCGVTMGSLHGSSAAEGGCAGADGHGAALAAAAAMSACNWEMMRAEGCSSSVVWGAPTKGWHAGGGHGDVP